MAITRYSPRLGVSTSPWRELEQVSDRLSRLFDDRWTPGERTNGAWLPAVNVEETGEEILLTAELPGLTRDQVDLEIENNVLTISGEKADTREEGGEDHRYHVWERSYGSFQRSFTLPNTVNAEGIEARFENGILYVHMPKQEAAKGRKIDIRTEG